MEGGMHYRGGIEKYYLCMEGQNEEDQSLAGVKTGEGPGRQPQSFQHFYHQHEKDEEEI